MVIRCPHLPWTITILPTNTTYVAVRDVFDGIFSSLRLAPLEAEFQCLSAKARDSVANAYIRRYKRIDDSEARQLEKIKGVKRVDFLGERTTFTGYQALWRVHMYGYSACHDDLSLRFHLAFVTVRTVVH
jgi:hypothetical protein